MVQKFNSIIPVQTHGQINDYIRSQSCSCGGKWIRTTQRLIVDSQQRAYDEIFVTCSRSKRETSFPFLL